MLGYHDTLRLTDFRRIPRFEIKIINERPSVRVSFVGAKKRQRLGVAFGLQVIAVVRVVLFFIEGVARLHIVPPVIRHLLEGAIQVVVVFTVVF